jgi:hypothetical protein
VSWAIAVWVIDRNRIIGCGQESFTSNPCRELQALLQWQHETFENITLLPLCRRG